jgi:hypothetical protein
MGESEHNGCSNCSGFQKGGRDRANEKWNIERLSYPSTTYYTYYKLIAWEAVQFRRSTQLWLE